MADGVSPMACSTSVLCHVCSDRVRQPHFLPCLHAFCHPCLQDECQGDSPNTFRCPVCVTADGRETESVRAVPWHSYSRALEMEEMEETEAEGNQLQARKAELPALEDGESLAEHSDDSSTGSGPDPPYGRKLSTVLEPPPSLFPCAMHPDRLSDTFCFRCNQLACNKCISSFHRRCQDFSELTSAVDKMRDEFDRLQSSMASNLVACDEVSDFHASRIKELDEMRTRVLIDIKTYRTELVNMILAKEKSLTLQTNRLIDQMKTEAISKREIASRISNSLQKQLDFLDLSISVKGEGELLPLLPGLSSRLEADSNLIGLQYTDDIREVTFVKDDQCKNTMTGSSLGHINVANTPVKELTHATADHTNDQAARPDLNLSLVTSFHGGTRDDVTEPLLTDLILLANGDVILTDRDNKCVKKFNQAGKLLTRVVIDAVPSRIASVSHGRAVVSVMTKKALYFLSLLGTVRVLHSVAVKKIYSFLTSVGSGLLVAGTNQCDSIDLLSERGETIRKIFTQKPDRAVIARPLYLTPVIPHSFISQRLHHPTSTRSIRKYADCSSPDSNGAGGTNTNNVDKNGQQTTVINDKSEHGLHNSSSQVIKNGKRGLQSFPSHSQSVSGSKNTRRKSLPPTKHSSNSNAHSSSLQPVTSLSSSSSSPQAPLTTTSSSSSSSSPTNIDLLVSDSGKRLLFRMQQDGQVTFTFKSKGETALDCPLGVTVHDSGLILLADRDNDCVLLLDKGGNCIKQILTSSDGVAKPCGLYAGTRGQVAMSQVDGMVKIYKPV